MLATRGVLPDGPGWAFEYKWDGIRALIATTKGGGIRITTRTGHDVTSWFPELNPLARALRRDAVLDGEVVALGTHGRPDFGRIQARLGAGNAALRTENPVEYYVFDVLRLDGRDLTGEPYARRRKVLEHLRLDGEHWATTPSRRGVGREMFDVSRATHLEGIVAKRLDAPYLPGRRSPAWIKVASRPRDEFVIGGWTDGQGGRRGAIGALLLGRFGSPQGAGKLVYMGRVGSGFRDAAVPALLRRLEAVSTPWSPFDSSGDEDDDDVHFVKPELVADVAYASLTAQGRLRQASFKGLRVDKAAREVFMDVSGKAQHAPRRNQKDSAPDGLHGPDALDGLEDP